MIGAASLVQTNDVVKEMNRAQRGCRDCWIL